MFRILKGIKINIVHNMVYNKCLCTSIIRKLFLACSALWDVLICGTELNSPRIKQNIEYNVLIWIFTLFSSSHDASAVVVLLLLLLRSSLIILSFFEVFFWILLLLASTAEQIPLPACLQDSQIPVFEITGKKFGKCFSTALTMR